MTEYNPPFSERKAEELIEIAHSSAEKWQQDAISMAKAELIKRNITIEEQNKVIEEWHIETEKYLKKEAERLENNKTESYEKWEIATLFLFGPILFIHPLIFNTHTLFTLRSENYYLKFKQRIVIFTLSFIAWIFYTDYTFEQSEKKRLEEIEKIDISDWEKKHGYE